MKTGARIKVYNQARTEVLAEVSRQTTSIGAAKAAGVLAAYQATIDGKPAWVAKSSYGKVS